MRISIWQQFSSNHSADFTIVSVFKTPEEAQKAAEELKRVLKTFAEWHADPQNQPLLREVGGSFAEDQENRLHTPPEIELDERFDIGFSFTPIDWLWDASRIVQTVATYQNMVYFSNDPLRHGIDLRTWSGEKPFDRLLEKLGGNTFVDGGTQESRFWLQIRATAKDEASASAIFNEIKAQAENDLQLKDIPRITWGWDDEDGRYQGNQLTFSPDVSDVWHVLPYLIAYLERRGCTDIIYTPVRMRE